MKATLTLEGDAFSPQQGEMPEKPAWLIPVRNGWGVVTLPSMRRWKFVIARPDIDVPPQAEFVMACPTARGAVILWRWQ